MLMSVVTSGVCEIHPSVSPGLVTLPSFQLPLPSGNGVSVRNIDACKALFQIFWKVFFRFFVQYLFEDYLFTIVTSILSLIAFKKFLLLNQVSVKL